MSAFRAYFFDLQTRQEIECDVNGKTWLGTSGMKMVDGEFVPDTCTFVEVADSASLRHVNGARKVTAADFPGRSVAVKVWAPGGTIDWRKLVEA